MKKIPESEPAAPAAPASVASPPAATPKESKAVTPMDRMRFNSAEHGREQWLCTAHANTDPKDLLDPAYWAHVSEKLRPRARIEAWADDGTWMAEYVVLEAGRNWARLHLLSVHYLTTADVAMTQAEQMSPYSVVHRGPHRKFSVIRKADGAVMHEGEETQEGAMAWFRERMKAGM